MARPTAEWIREHGYGTAFDRLKKRTKRQGECLLFVGHTGSCLPQIRVCVDGVGWVESAQRLAWIAKHGEIRDGSAVVRTCGETTCVEHLKLLSLRDAARLGNPSIDITGKKFGRWTAIERERYRQSDGRIAIRWRCRCTCGTTRMVALRSLKHGLSQSCGCLKRERVSAANKRRAKRRAA